MGGLTKESIGSRKTVTWMGTIYSVTVSQRDSAGILGVFEGIVPAGDGPPLHVHHNEDEVIHIVEGVYEFWLDGTRFTRSAGASVFLPRGVPHTFRVIGDHHGRNLGVVTPGGFERFFLEAAERQLTIPDRMPEVLDLASQYGLEFRGPAPWSQGA